MAPLAFPEIRQIPPLLHKAPETTITSALPSESGISEKGTTEDEMAGWHQ